MLDPRVYRTGFVAVAVAVVLLAFSLHDQPAALTTTLAPDAFNGQNAYSLTNKLAANYPNRRPGSAGDDALAGEVAQTFGRFGFGVSTQTFTARTADGTRTLETVTGTRPGLGGGSIVVLGHRDALSSPAAGELSGTATLLELARVLAGETHHRTIILASTSGSAGDAGAMQLARNLGGIDAVIALGDLGAAHLREPLIVPWSKGQDVAPPALRNTVAVALGAQAGLAPGGTSLAGQLVHLAFPLTISEQGAFGGRGVPAVLLSASGERPAPAGEAPVADRVTSFGRTVLQTINALDAGPGISASSPYLLYDSKVVPAWAIRVLVLGLLAPVLVATVDGLARARRRGHTILRWISWVLAASIPFALVVLVILGARLLDAFTATPPGPVGAGAVPLDGAGVGVLIALAVVLAASLAGLGWVWPRIEGAASVGRRRERESGASGRAVALLLVMCGAALAIWLRNPFAALLLVPALHLWMWLLDPELPTSPAVRTGLLVVGLAAPALVLLYYAVTLGLTPIEVIWNGVLLIAGGHVSAVAALEWSVVLGCVMCVVAAATRERHERQAEDAAISIRGPVTYAGPGSLGGTESALRR